MHAIDSGRGVWAQVSRGIGALNGVEMRAGDGAAVERDRGITLEGDTDAEVLAFDLT